MVIVPVAFIVGAPKGADDQPTGQNTTFLFSGNATSELGTYITVKAILKCPLSGYLEMSGFTVGLAACFPSV
ncbi:hypothetical protein K6W16_05600 [Burkholderia dolosa]|uniref:Uncharacterized protein n=2 Tax=Burkholderiaceae TaxID=119060 RepID=A0A892ICL2_9BURK|nr:hypothetical protein [Burkholderia dolosa]MBR8418279.1 hypothetical protein [Burkholderia dolosa]MBY4657001.1 hypothetical protein [Burkholderia dolosa]MBY4688165.1 hypothetical protein [Burkholderia dolosa]MBY4783552.1 hypothetical protein [Burkholderia dolosa]MBY4786082.1 hypothetical protein [Burkholderia dolosa]